MTDILRVKEHGGVQSMWKGESIAWNITTTPWASTPVVTSFKLYSPTEVDVTATQASGSASEAGDVVTTPLVTPTGVGTYRAVLTFTSGGLTFIALWDIDVTNPLDFV
jgi:hypothetical protein